MKETVGKISRGIIEYNAPSLEVSEAVIERKIERGTIFSDEFCVYSEDGRDLKGIVYSSNCVVKVINTQFISSNNVIKYEIDTTYLEENEKIEGKFVIVSSGGEALIGFSFTITTPSVKASIGEINDLFNFANLVKTDYDEAVRLFSSKNFKDIFLRGNITGQALYDGLIKSSNVHKALEEFLIGINKKSRINISLSESNKDYDKLEDSYGDKVIISKDTWGYIDIDVHVQGDFISKYKSRITTEDFAGSNYEFTYLIDVSKLHAGMNYGTITFSTTFQKLILQISVDNTSENDIGRIEVKRCMYNLMQLYLKLRSRRCSVENWADESFALIERARGFDDDNDFLKLVLAQIYITRDREEEAEWLLSAVAENILDDIDNNLEIYCYYLYIRTLQRRDAGFTSDIFAKIKKYYENGYDSWKILWILLYLDDAYETNASLKLARIKEQFKKGCKSPLMYYEALSVFNKHPGLLRVINDFELQVILFGCKHDMTTQKLAFQVAELTMMEKNFRPLLFKSLATLYKKFEDKNILTALCSILIRGNITSNRYFEWYAEGVKKEINLTRLYEYYMFSIDENYNDVLPNMIYMYFVYNGNLLFYRESLLYANIIANKDRIPNVYKNYKVNMERFAIENLAKGVMNKNVALIYREFLQGSMIKEDIAKNLPHILATYEISCPNRKIQRIIVLHKELNIERAYILRDGKANIEIFTEDAVILLEDVYGNRCVRTEDVKERKLLDNNSLLQLCHDKCNDDIYYIAGAAEQFIRYHNSTHETIGTFKNIMDIPEFRYDFCKAIMRDIIEYYYTHYDGDELDEYLVSIEMSELDGSSRDKVIELMIVRGLYVNAYEAMKKYGYQRLGSRKLVKFVTRYLYMVNDAEDGFITDVAGYAFSKGKYNENVLEYLCRYYNSTTKEMIELWKTAKNFSFESRELEERLIAQILFGKSKIGYLVKLYDSYLSKGETEVVKKAYYFYVAYMYFVKDIPVYDDYFSQLEREISIQKVSHDILNDVCKAAYLKYMSGKSDMSDKQKELCKYCMEYLLDKGYCFEFFKLFIKWFELPGNVCDRAIIEYRTSPDCDVYVHYAMKNDFDDSGYQVCKMQDCFGGVFTKDITVFYGENIQYYITEENEKGTNITESKDYYLGDEIVFTGRTAYGMINDILRCKELKEEATVRELTKDYYLNKCLSKEIFEII
ncbi:MAG: hypothetical protein IJC76_00990 [Lachnospiraceae bacterium]|nr:hypothetical protein [Lachnospiraceae bacterium]